MPKIKTPLSEVKGVGKKTEESLSKAGINTAEDLSRYTVEKLEGLVPNISATTLKKIISNAKEVVQASKRTTKSKTEREVKTKTAKDAEAVKKKTGKERKVSVSKEKVKKGAKPEAEERKVKTLKKKVKKVISETPKAKTGTNVIGKVYSFVRGGCTTSNKEVLAHITDASRKIDELLGRKVWLKYGNGITVKGKIAGRHGHASKVRIRLDRSLSTDALNSYIYL